MIENAKLSQQFVLVTGANGFVGSHVINALLRNGYSVKAVVRNPWSNAPYGVEVLVANLSLPIDWNDALRGVTTIIHLAARVHQMDESLQMALDEYKNINTRATLVLAEQAAKAGVKRFIYLSSIAVNGAFTAPGEYFTEQSEPSPVSPYAISKYESELGLQKLAHKYAMEYVIIRPPMVYGLEAPGNFSRLVSIIKSRIPLPFGLASNYRSFIFIKNLLNFILVCIEHPTAGNQLFLVSDDDDLSIQALVKKISRNLRLRTMNFPFPIGVLEKFFVIFGKVALKNQLFKPMRVDISKARIMLGWTPPYSSTKGLELSIKNNNSSVRYNK